ncbi:DUF4340 domain-containing protein [Amphibacillus indicireducens]|uniref:DUF4340 domain-containing protein n=1 Tax=Amphibacillus indicireducens TaxID=1076330 RepID=A0ABP7VHV6_9BACI
MNRLSRKVKIIFALSLTIVLAILIWQFPFEESEGEAEHRFIDQEKQVDKITIQSEQSFTIEKEGQDWRVVDRLETTNHQAVEQGLERLKQWSGEQVDVKRKDVGLDVPFLSLRVDYDDATESRLMIGQLDASGENFYIEDRQQEAIYLVERSLIEAFPFYVQAFLDTSLLPWSASEVETILIDNGTEMIHLTKNNPYPEEETRANLTGWLIEAPYQHYHHTTYSIMEKLLQSVQSFQMLELIDDNVSDWSAYGLESSQFTIELITANDHIKFLIGAPASGQSYFARIEGENQVFTLSNQLLEAFSYQAKNYHDGYVKLLALDVMNQLSIKSDQLTVDIEIDQIDQELTEFKVDGQLLDESEWRDAYKLLAGLRTSGVAIDKPAQEADVVITSTIVHDQGEKEVTLEFVDYSDEYYAVYLDQVSDFLVEKIAVEEALAEIEAVLN